MSEVPGSYPHVLARLSSRLREPAPGRIQILTGPRQIGKTTLLLELARTLGPAARYVAGDDPASAMPGAWDRIWEEAEAAARQAPTMLLLDEVQHWPEWAARLKGRWDRARRHRLALHVVASGSSALRLGAGSQESLAGRFERLSLTHWPAAAIADTFGLTARAAAQALVRVGTYPGAFPLRGDPPRWRAYVRDAIIEPAISRDVLALGGVRRPALLRQVFAAAAGLPAQVVSLQKLQGRLATAALETVAHYLSLLEQAYLVAPIEKHSARVVRRRAAPPKLVVLNNALISALHPDGPPDPEREPARFGQWLENACLAHAWNTGHHVQYWREEPLEVDGVIDGPWGPWAMEVKTGRVSGGDLRGVLEFCRRFPRFAPLVVTEAASVSAATSLGVAALSWEDYLIAGGPPARRS